MGHQASSSIAVIYSLFILSAIQHCIAYELKANRTALLTVAASRQLGQKIPDTLFGIFFEVSKTLVYKFIPVYTCGIPNFIHFMELGMPFSWLPTSAKFYFHISRL